MTEEEWLAATDPIPMLDLLKGASSDRKFRLFGVACCRLKWDSLTDQASRAVVVIAEKYADGMTTRKELRRARRAAFTGWKFSKPLSAWHAADDRAWEGACAATEDVAPRRGAELDADGMRRCCQLARDIFGNPFRPISIDPSWRTSTVLSLAHQMYDARDFTAMPILADALQDAGCPSEDILAHCRGAGPHARGCWVVDLLLGKG